MLGLVNKKAMLSKRKPQDAAAFLFGLKFANNTHYKFRSSQASKARLQSFQVPTYWRKTEFNAKWPVKVTCFGVSGKAIRDLVILYNNVGLISHYYRFFYILLLKLWALLTEINKTKEAADSKNIYTNWFNTYDRPEYTKKFSEYTKNSVLLIRCYNHTGNNVHIISCHINVQRCDFENGQFVTSIDVTTALHYNFGPLSNFTTEKYVE